MPFLTEHLWQILVRDVRRGSRRRRCTSPAGRTRRSPTRRCSRRSRRCGASSVSAIRRGRPRGSKLRQPLRRLVVEGAPLAEAHADELREELRVKEVEFGPVEATELHVKPHLPALGPKLGKELGAVRAALAAGEFEQLEGGGFRVLGHDLGPDEVLVERSGKEGWAVASEEGVTVALDTTLDAELELEGRVYDLIHTLNSMRKEQGLELTDRITVTLPQADADLVERHAEWIKARGARGLARDRRRRRAADRQGLAPAPPRRPLTLGDCLLRERGTTLSDEEARCTRASSAAGRSVEAFRYCPWCAAPQRAKLVEFFTGTGAEAGKALRVSRYTDEGHVRFSVWDESGVAEAAVSIDDDEAHGSPRFSACASVSGSLLDRLRA